MAEENYLNSLRRTCLSDDTPQANSGAGNPGTSPKAARADHAHSEIVGLPGAKGDKGDAGSPGAAGSAGAAGTPGAQGPAGFGAVTPSTPTRSLGVAFRPSLTKVVLCIYSVKSQVTNPLLAGSSVATVKLLSDAAATPTTERARTEALSSVVLAVAIAITTANTSVLAYIVPAGHYVLLQSAVTGTAANSIVAQTEIELG